MIMPKNRLSSGTASFYAALSSVRARNSRRHGLSVREGLPTVLPGCFASDTSVSKKVGKVNVHIGVKQPHGKSSSHRMPR